MKSLKKVFAAFLAIAVMMMGLSTTAFADESVTKEALKAANVTVKSVTYNGKNQTASITVKNAAGTTLKKGTDYTVSGATKKDAGTYTVTVKGIGRYKGTVSKKFTIKKADIADAKVTIPSKSYTGKSLTAKVTVKFNGVTLTEGTDYKATGKTHTYAAAHPVTITGKGNFTGSTSADFTIKGVSSNLKATAAKTTVTRSTKKDQTIKITASKRAANKNTIKYKVVTANASKSVTVSSKGVITVKKNAKKGTYKIEVSVACYQGYLPGSTTITIKVK
jgi:hypothetical protein